MNFSNISVWVKRVNVSASVGDEAGGGCWDFNLSRAFIPRLSLMSSESLMMLLNEQWTTLLRQPAWERWQKVKCESACGGDFSGAAVEFMLAVNPATCRCAGRASFTSYINIFVNAWVSWEPFPFVVKLFSTQVSCVLMFACLNNWQLTSHFSKAKTPGGRLGPGGDSSGRSGLQFWVGREVSRGLGQSYSDFKAWPQTSVCCCCSSCKPSTPAFRRAGLFSQRVSDVPGLQHPRGVSPRIFFRGADWARNTRPVLLDLWLRKICIPALRTNMW